MNKIPFSRYFWLAVTGMTVLAAGPSHAEERKPRVVFNDDAQMLSEAPVEGTSQFVKAWLDKEAAAVPFSTYVFLAATPDICTYDSQAGETYGSSHKKRNIDLDAVD